MAPSKMTDATDQARATDSPNTGSNEISCDINLQGRFSILFHSSRSLSTAVVGSRFGTDDAYSQWFAPPVCHVGGATF